MDSARMDKLVVLELNEMNFTFVEEYIRLGKMPGFSRLFERHGFSETTSESSYEELEPWIQWVTAHSGRTFAEHGVFRLGDITGTEIEQIWEHVERELGASVAAVSPMNALNRTRNSPFFVPDPWTGGIVSGPAHLSKLYGVISQVVNENASGGLDAHTIGQLMLGLLRHGRIESWPDYLRLAAGASRGKWRKALFLDRLLADLFIKSWNRSRPDFSTLFLNAAAHIQHHYMFSSAAYSGAARNPQWYVREGDDPVLEVYELYDRLLVQIGKLPNTRLMVMTGLHQDPHETVTYYYRLRDHEEFLRKLGIRFASVEPRMSRDFLISFSSLEEAKVAERVLGSIQAENQGAVFTVDNRGCDLFVMLSYANRIDASFSMTANSQKYSDFAADVAFVAIKNGEHNGVGYFADTGSQKSIVPTAFPLTDVYDLVFKAVQVARPERRATPV